ncbi:MAG: DUF3795 domain-containing protein [Bacillota bacterium]|nr:DUF3795 domain-containing protein [Bacillota bacterium]
MIESRCGVLCSKCKFKEPMNCNGCTNITKPFWAEQCSIKSCCELRALEHCGNCQDFPCDLLKQYSYDPKYGDHGKRIERCKEWAFCFKRGTEGCV